MIYVVELIVYESWCIDDDYTGNIGIIVDNIGKHTIRLNKGYKLAQLVVAPIVMPELNCINEFTNQSIRGENGFGSSGY